MSEDRDFAARSFRDHVESYGVVLGHVSWFKPTLNDIADYVVSILMTHDAVLAGRPMTIEPDWARMRALGEGTGEKISWEK
ncbi:MAG: hypothetical protein AAFZ01_07610 [Pseudomonadota bacterium]